MRSGILWVGLMAAALLVAALAYGCGETSFGTCADNGTCVPDGGLLDGTSPNDSSDDVALHPDGGPVEDGNVARKDGETGVSEGGPGACDATGTAEPKDEPCLVDGAYGVFVSATTGTANGAGTKASPLKSIDAGITLAAMQGGATPKRVYVCAGTYDETIAIGAARDKVKVFGGFQCSDWAYTGALPTIAPSTQGVALTLTGLTSALFADVEIDAQSAPATPPDAGSAPGASSIAVLANGATGVEFRRTKIVAGNGQPGADGVLVAYTSAMLPVAADLHGNPGDGGAGGAAKSYTCPGGSVTTGGKGGDSPGGSGDPGLPALSQNDGTGIQCSGATGGGVGVNGLAAASANGALGAGTFAAGSWQPAPGSSGSPGGPGQGGGGGGGGNTMTPGGGGGGGAGGCGGAGGGGGGGGGASAPIVTIESGVMLTNSALLSATAGNGGAGVAGQPGQAVSGGGGVPDSNGGCLGGHGANGGAGGAGGGGAGGVSAGILYKGTAPTVDTATASKFTQGQAGTKGSGGAPGTNDGINGPTGIQVLGQ